MSGERLSDALVANLAVWAADAKATAREVEALAREVQESRAEVERLRTAGSRLAAAINAVACSGPWDAMVELTAAYIDWEALHHG